MVLSRLAAPLRPFNHPLTHFSPYLRGTFKKVSLENSIAHKMSADDRGVPADLMRIEFTDQF